MPKVTPKAAPEADDDIIEDFASYDDTPTEDIPANVHQFEGNGTKFLPLPGAVSVEGVRVGSTPLPSFFEVEVPIDSTGKTQVQRVRGYKLVVIEGQPNLVRASISNDGVWQKGEAIYVAGDFA